MANRKFKISTSRLGKDIEQIQNLLVLMERSITNMQTSVEQMNKMWEGLSKQAFVTAFSDDMKSVSDVLKELKSLNNYEIDAKNDYENCERQVADLISHMRI